MAEWHEVLRTKLDELRETDPAEGLNLIRLVHKCAKMETVWVVEAARGRGMSWAEIATRLHISEDEALARYGAVDQAVEQPGRTRTPDPAR